MMPDGKQNKNFYSRGNFSDIHTLGEQGGVEVGYLPSTPGTRVQIPGRASE